MNGTVAMKSDNETKEMPDPSPRAVREAAGLDRTAMADLMGMSEFGYASWENGTRRPGGPAFQLLRLIEADPKAAMTLLQA